MHHVGGDGFASFRPLIQNLVVTFVARHQTAIVSFLVLHDGLFGILDEGLLAFRRDQVVGGKGQTAASRFAEAHLHHVVQQVDRRASTDALDSSH